VTRPVGDWLNAQLSFTRWPPAGETSVLEWAERNHAPMDKGYLQREREGGTQAMGTGVPGLTREQLSVLPEAEWERQKDRLVWESWVERARARR
jgi:hypothetical protein